MCSLSLINKHQAWLVEPGACAIKLFTAVIGTISEIAIAFVNAIHYHPSLMFACNTRSLPLEWSSVRGSTLVGPKYLTRVKVGSE